MQTGKVGRAFLGVGREAPPPSGPEDPNFKKAMLREARAWTFRLRVNFWSRLTGRGKFDWQEFEKRLEESEFRAFATKRESLASGGWAGLGSDGRWLFGVAAYWVPLLGQSAMRHELFHAVQDFRTGLFSRKSGLLACVAAEYSAHLWGGPLIGVPIVYGGTLFIVVGIVFVFLALAGIV